MRANQFTPKATLETALREWWVMVFVILLGAGAGWCAHALRSEVYEGRAALSTGIDYVRTGPLNDVEEDQAMELIGDIIRADDVLQAALTEAQSQGVQLALEDFKTMAYSERSNFRWVLRVRDTQPAAAAVLTNAWLDAAYAALEEAYDHALVAEDLLRYSRSLTSCLESGVQVEPVQAFCSAKNLKEIQQELLDVNAAKAEELLASRGLFPAMAFTIVERSGVPDLPVQNGRNSLVFSGAAMGFVVAAGLIFWNVPAILRRKVDRG